MNKKNKQILFIAATRQNDGKTMVSLGLFNAIQEEIKNCAYIKPIGQQYHWVEKKQIDKDAILFKKIYNLKTALKHMSPVAIPEGFTQKFINKNNNEKLKKEIIHAKKELLKNNQFLLAEGTGHAGVGSVLNLSNSDTAKLIGAKVILVSIGGIGKTIDEICLNKALFEQKGIQLMGVIINKIKKDKYKKVSKYLKKGLEQQGIKVYGCIPFVEMLIKPRVASIFEHLAVNVLAGKEKLLNKVGKIIIGDMVPHDLISMLKPNTVLIVPANREGLIMTALSGSLLDIKTKDFLSGLIFTDGKKPHKKVLALVKKIHIPTLLVKEDSFTVATKINQILIKLKHEEQDKILKIQELIKEHINIKEIISDL